MTKLLEYPSFDAAAACNLLKVAAQEVADWQPEHGAPLFECAATGPTYVSMCTCMVAMHFLNPTAFVLGSGVIMLPIH